MHVGMFQTAPPSTPPEPKPLPKTLKAATAELHTLDDDVEKLQQLLRDTNAQLEQVAWKADHSPDMGLDVEKRKLQIRIQTTERMLKDYTARRREVQAHVVPLAEQTLNNSRQMKKIRKDFETGLSMLYSAILEEDRLRQEARDRGEPISLYASATQSPCISRAQVLKEFG